MPGPALTIEQRRALQLLAQAPLALAAQVRLELGEHTSHVEHSVHQLDSPPVSRLRTV